MKKLISVTFNVLLYLVTLVLCLFGALVALDKLGITGSFFYPFFEWIERVFFLEIALLFLVLYFLQLSLVIDIDDKQIIQSFIKKLFSMKGETGFLWIAVQLYMGVTLINLETGFIFYVGIIVFLYALWKIYQSINSTKNPAL